MKWIVVTIILSCFWRNGFAEESAFVYSYTMAALCKESVSYGYNYNRFYPVKPVWTSSANIVTEMHIGIQAISSAHILLSPVPNPQADSPVYEIVVGAGGNTYSVIRRGLGTGIGNRADTPSILNYIELKGFFIKIYAKIVFCYYGTWATYRWGDGMFDVGNINPFLCSHIAYTFAGITNEGTVISLDPYLDLAENWGRDNFRKFTALKNQNPKLKTMLAVGGWNEGSAKYSVMAASPTLRANFIQSALQMILDHGFDGLDLDWEYPGRRDSVYGPADVENFSQLLRELRPVFDEHGLILSSAVSAVEQTSALSYDVPTISKYLDIINVMTYDMYGSWDPVTGHNAPLHAGIGDENTPYDSLFTIDNAVKYWIKAGAPPKKLVLGVPFYGRTFTLTNANQNTVRSPASGPGLAGPYTATNGMIGYNEFCVKLQSEPWTVRYDLLAKVPYAYSGLNWVSFDNIKSIKIKTEFAKLLGLGGVMMWSIETDDFNGRCGSVDFPLLRAINKVLRRDVPESTSTTASVTSSTESSAPTENPVSSENPSSSEKPSTESTSTTSVAPTEPTSICKKEGFLANPDDCRTYFVCIFNASGELIPIKFHCPHTLLWDQEDLFCNYAEEVTCNQ